VTKVSNWKYIYYFLWDTKIYGLLKKILPNIKILYTTKKYLPQNTLFQFLLDFYNHNFLQICCCTLVPLSKSAPLPPNCNFCLSYYVPGQKPGGADTGHTKRAGRRQDPKFDDYSQNSSEFFGFFLVLSDKFLNLIWVLLSISISYHLPIMTHEKINGRENSNF
jgi:hypothetical protein